MKYLFVLIFFNMAISKTIIISDIDETIKQSNGMNYSNALWRIVYKKALAFKGLSSIFKKIHNQDNSQFYYLSASYKFLYDADKWLVENDLGFHEQAFQRKLKSKKMEYKLSRVESILSQAYEEGDIVFLFGDNLAYDASVYRKIINTHSEKKIFAFIRDVKGEKLFIENKEDIKNSKVKYFLTVLDLINSPVLDLDLENKEEIKKLGKKDLLPDYISRYLARKYVSRSCKKVISSLKCKKYYQAKIINYFDKYFKDQLIQ